MENTPIAFPDNYTPPVASSNYLKFTENGKYYFRILSAPLIWFEYWQKKPTDEKDTPVRTKEKVKDSELLFPAVNKFGEKSYSREFYAFKVFHYDDNKRKTWNIKVLSSTTASIKQQIRNFMMSPDLPPADHYDMIIERSGEGKATKYILSRCDSSDKNDDLVKAETSTPVNLEAILYNKDPFDVTDGVFE